MHVGSDVRAAIGSGLHHCKGLIAVITNKYIESNYCPNELYVAHSDGKHIFPVIFEDVDLKRTEKSRAVKFVIQGINWAYFQPKKDNYESFLSDLMNGMTDAGKQYVFMYIHRVAFTEVHLALLSVLICHLCSLFCFLFIHLVCVCTCAYSVP